MKEIWKPVPGHRNLFQVSSRGRVRKIRSNGLRILTQWHFKMWLRSVDTYPIVALCYGGTQVKVFVHQLVAVAFIGPRPRKHVINHKDGNTHHNIPSNLEYVTPAENMRHAWRIGLIRRPVRKSRCRFGHKMTSENTYTYKPKPGSRYMSDHVLFYCRECRRIKARARYHGQSVPSLPWVRIPAR